MSGRYGWAYTFVPSSSAHYLSFLLAVFRPPAWLVHSSPFFLLSMLAFFFGIASLGLPSFAIPETVGSYFHVQAIALFSCARSAEALSLSSRIDKEPLMRCHGAVDRGIRAGRSE